MHIVRYVNTIADKSIQLHMPTADFVVHSHFPGILKLGQNQNGLSTLSSHISMSMKFTDCNFTNEVQNSQSFQKHHLMFYSHCGIFTMFSNLEGLYKNSSCILGKPLMPSLLKITHRDLLTN